MNSRMWSETVRVTQEDKLTRQAPPLAAVALQRHNIHDRKHYRPRGTGMHPVLGHYVDPVKEHTVTQTQQERTLIRGNIARDKQLKQMQDHNILTKIPLVEQPPPPPSREISRTFASGAPFDILSGEGIPPELMSDAARTVRPQRPMINYAPSFVRRRAVDILSNMYVQDHEAKSTRDTLRAREHALERYWQTHNFNPVTQTYVDPEKEAAAQEIIEMSKTVQGIAQKARLPPSIRISTGAAYDIVNHIPTDPQVLNTVDLMETRPLRVRTRLATEERLHTAGEARSALESVRSVQRVNQRRYEELFDSRGYNVVTNLPRDAAVLEKTLAGRPMTQWERVSRDLQTAPSSL